MKLSIILNFALAFVLSLSGIALGQDKTEREKTNKRTQTSKTEQGDRDMKDEIKQSQKAAKVFNEIMRAPDNNIPQNFINDAECIAVFPEVLKAGFVVGGRGGRGLASCRVGNTWSAPAYLNLGGASLGLQIGAQSTDFVFLIMNKEGVESLLQSNVELGADASIAAGPVGRQAGASTDAKFNAQILSYSRSKGLFAGLELKGGVIETDEDDMRDAYGRNATAREVLKQNKSEAPAEIRAFPDTLARYSTRSGSKASN
jgi:SH3 domain-containing YSC84-like protein 1